MTSKPWKQQKQSYLDALVYMKGRQQGTITSVKTPWSKLNGATTDGFEWHSMTVIGGRPGSGKTLIKDQFIRECFKLNPGSNIRVLEFSLEMVGRASAMRGMSAHIEKSYNDLCSVGEKMTDAEIETCRLYAKGMIDYPIDVIEEVENVSDFEKSIHDYMKTNSSIVMIDDKPRTQYQNSIITLDHSLLINEKNKHDMLYALGACLTKLKRRYPIIFIILSQLNRNMDHPDRNEDGKYGNYVLESDIFGSDALLQHADFVIGLNRPGKAKIRLYGPDKYIVEDNNLLVMHFLKARNGETGLSFFNAMFRKMKIEEREPPPQQQGRSSRF